MLYVVIDLAHEVLSSAQ